MSNARLILADGTVFSGESFGAAATRGGEVVFNTAHTGYQEVITDPSYCGQIVCMTCPLQGNYGINEQDDESARPFVEGFVVRELSAVRSNYRSRRALDEWLAQHGVPGISGVDTRQLTLHLRTLGACNALLTSSDEPAAVLLERARNLPNMTGLDLVQRVATGTSADWNRGFDPGFAPSPPLPHTGRRIVAIDCGMKRNILRNLVHVGFDVRMVSPRCGAAEILDQQPAGVFVSNGPGDPAAVTYVQQTLRDLIGRVPIFGICLGHQLLALALGARTFKLKFGHHGYNHPVQNLLTGRVEITSQNHGFAVEPESLTRVGGVQTHINLYDRTNEGFAHRELPVFAVQYHPEAAPGPHDAAYLFDVFRMVIDTAAPPTAEQMRAAQQRLAEAHAVA